MEKFDSMITEIKTITDKINKLEQQLQSFVKLELQPLFDAFFEQHKCIKAITWTQYTPYFNDGEPCEFNVYDLNAFLKLEGQLSYQDYNTKEICYEDVEEALDSGYPAEEYDEVVSTYDKVENVPEHLGYTQEAKSDLERLELFIHNNSRAMTG